MKYKKICRICKKEFESEIKDKDVDTWCKDCRTRISSANKIAFNKFIKSLDNKLNKKI